MNFTFEKCRELAATNPDYAFCDTYLPRLEQAFSKWKAELDWVQITASEQHYTYIYLSEHIEADIAGLMFDNPSQAWALAALAYVMLRLKAKEILGVVGCLPMPLLRGELAEKLVDKGLLINGRLLHRFSLLTFSSTQLDCASCSLAPECPQKK